MANNNFKIQNGFGGWSGNGQGPYFPSLPQSITLNSITIPATAIYSGRNANSSTWAATLGSDLIISGSRFPSNNERRNRSEKQRR